MGVQFLHARDYGAHLMSANTLRGGGERLKWMVWLGFGYLFDLRSVFRNCWVRGISVGEGFAHSSICKCVKDASALCQKRTLEVSIINVVYAVRETLVSFWRDNVISSEKVLLHLRVSQLSIDNWVEISAVALSHISGVRPCRSRGRRPSETGAGWLQRMKDMLEVSRGTRDL